VLSAEQTKVWLGQTTTDRYLHAARGIHAQQLHGGAWQHPLHDGLGSVRSVVDSTVATLNHVSYSAYGTPDAAVGSPFAFTGEQRDSSGLQYHRARYYSPALGIFTSRDPFEGMAGRPMSLNGYSWVEGNVVNAVDPSGLECVSWNDIQPGGGNFDPYRYYACADLENTLYTTLNTPTWEEVFACYNCAMTAANRSVEAYRQGLMQAIYDEMDGASIDRVETAIRRYAENHVLQPEQVQEQLQGSIITSGLLNGNGYIEGWTLGGAIAIAGGQFGREIVYNLATFQRAEFSFRAGGFNNFQPKASAGLAHYVGYVAGFIPDNQYPCRPGDMYSTFMSQYLGDFVVYSGGYAAGAGAGVTHFHSPPGTENGVRGQSTFIQAGIGLGVGVTIATYYRTYAYEKSYIGWDGRVDIEALTQDIRSGDGSPLYLLGVVSDTYGAYLRDAREQAVRAAHDKALIYNNSSAARSRDC